MSDFLPDRYQEMQDEIDWLKVTLEVFVDMRREADAEIERLREALERIWHPSNWDERKGGNWWGDSHPRAIAFSALNKGGEG